MDTISIVSVVDVVAALAADSLSGSYYLVDNNRTNGSLGEGTDSLKTKVRKGDRVVWVSIPLESEAYVSITAVEIEPKLRDYCSVKKGVYPDTNIVYWLGEIRKDLDVAIPYVLKFKLGSRTDDLATDALPALVGDVAVAAPAVETASA